ncbi:MAG: aspartate--tRNA ligase [bacterium]
MSYKNRTWCGTIGIKHLNQEVELYGWVNRVRDMGNLIFIDLRDRTGIVQLVVNSQNISNFEQVKEISNEYVIKVRGKVRQRPKDKINLKISTGEYEIDVNNIELISKSLPTPFSINEEEYKEILTDESLRLKYRYLDLRRSKMFKNLYFRHKLIKKMRDFLEKKEFLEVETPILSKPTPEGARDFLVPSRIQKGKFYALPQSPQLYKQLLMVAGIERYFQVAKCLRDEDLRADRQPEFTQLDIEMSFITIDDIFDIIEEMLKEAISLTFGLEINTPFSVMSYQKAMEEYISDKPDLRFPYPIKKFNPEELNYSGNMEGEGYFIIFPLAILRKEIDYLYNNGYKFLYLIKDSENLKGPLVKFIDSSKLDEFIQKYKDSDQNFKNLTMMLIFNQSKEKLKEIKEILINRKVLLPTCSFYFLWIKDFPLFKVEEDLKISPEHHPFTNVHPADKEKLMKLYEKMKKFPDSIKDNDFINEILSIRSLAYDLVLNGSEIGSGSIRITDSELQQIIFNMIGLSEEESDKKFGFLLNAFKYGVPPHGGIALGLDRLISIFLGANSIRDVIAFPKTQSGSCLLTSSPSEVSEEQLKELGILPLAQERYIKN